MIAPEAVGKIARFLAAHPEGVLPRGFPFREIADSCEQFVELTGKAGDVILLHPLMLHSASRNNLRLPRIITNPRVSIREPFNLNRPNVDDYSLVELKTLKELGVDPLTNGGKGYDFVVKGERKPIVPERLKIQAEWKQQELERLARIQAVA